MAIARKAKKPRKMVIQDDSSSSTPKEEPVKSPPLEEEVLELRDYQKTAVDWMYGKFKDPMFRGCLLADDMGTGKTG